ncbi:MAG: GDP-mannose 4,6-dehydratase [Candidatus Odinarchaeia archaeon]
MKILVTGGCGFIGSHLVKALASKGYEITVLDNLYKGDIRKLKEVEKNVEIVIGDIRDGKTVNSLVSQSDIIFHLAAQVSVVESIRNPVFDAETNIIGTINLLKSASQHDCKLFVYFSSAAVYGNPREIPIKESHPTNPLSPYGVSKFSGEKYCKMFYETLGLPVVILRLFNVYGIGQNPESPYSGVITKFVYKALKNEPLTIYGDGMQTRDFIYVNDVTEVCSRLLEKNNVIGETFNVASGTETSIKTLAEKIISLSNSKSHIEFVPPRPGEIKRSLADVTKLKKVLGYAADTNISEGLMHLIEEFKKYINR